MSFEGSLWTGRIYDHQKIRKLMPDAILVCVMRWPPRYVSLKKEGIEHVPSFSPSRKLLKWAREPQEDIAWADEKMRWEVFLQRFVLEFKENEQALIDRNAIREDLKAGATIVLLCHERPEQNCHREILPYLLLEEDEMYCFKGEVSFETKEKKMDWW